MSSRRAGHRRCPHGAELDRVGVGEVADLSVMRDGKERRVKVKVSDANR
jgi:hypothetical protein